MATIEVQALRIALDADSQDAINVLISTEDFNNTENWVICPLSKQLGLPIKVGLLPMPDEVQEENKTAKTLFLDTIITSPTFALPVCQPSLGSVVVARCDGHDFDTDALAALTGTTLAFIDIARDRSKDVMNGAESIDEFYAKARARFTRDTAAKVYRDLREGDSGYLNPFRVDQAGGVPFCDLCGAVKTASGGALLVCGRCGGGRYCSKECQKQEWNKHKEGCKKAT